MGQMVLIQIKKQELGETTVLQLGPCEQLWECIQAEPLNLIHSLLG